MPSPAAGRLASILSSKGLTASCAESLTGGLIGASITSVPGASSFFKGSAVTYTNEAKESVLGVPYGVLTEYGAVSAQTARLMAKGARRLYRADVSVAVTGVAGPGGGTPETPVGLVFVAVSSQRGERAERLMLEGDRESVRAQTVERALGMLADEAESLRRTFPVQI